MKGNATQPELEIIRVRVCTVYKRDLVCVLVLSFSWEQGHLQARRRKAVGFDLLGDTENIESKHTSRSMVT